MRVTAECVGTLPTIAEEMKNVLCEWKEMMFVCFLGLYGLYDYVYAYVTMSMPMWLCLCSMFCKNPTCKWWNRKKRNERIFNSEGLIKQNLLQLVDYNTLGGFYSYLGVFVIFVGGGGALLTLIALAIADTNLRNTGLISVDRRTSLLSHVQYPDPDQSRLQRIYHSQCHRGD